MHPFVLKLRHGAQLSSDDEVTLEKLTEYKRFFDRGADIFADGTDPHSIVLISEGWACRYKHLSDGKRQIISLFLPGDLCEPFGVLPEFMDHSLGALTSVSAVQLPINALRSVWQARPGIEKALWWDMLQCDAISRERVISLGRRSAVERVGHLICELYLRLQVVGLAENLSYKLPLTQTDLADLSGLSLVHLNRSLQDLRKLNFLAIQGRQVTINNFAGLSDLSFFDPAYLRIKAAPID